MTKLGFLSTYPPTRCGLATFTEALAGAMAYPGSRQACVVRVVDEPTPLNERRFGRRAVIAELVAGDALGRSASIQVLNGFDVVIVQHEYGIYGGPDGDEIVDVLEGVTAPTIVVFHTVLDAPTVHQKQVLERVAELGTSLVVMSDQALANLARYDVPMRKVRLIPHGVPESSFAAHDRPLGHRVLTWGLIGPGKGIEWGIRAMAELADMLPRPEYVVVGKTHPKVLAHAGEAYRESLEQIVAHLHLENVVTFVDEYLDAHQLARYVDSADVVLVPYDSKDQVTSGVLVEAVAAGKPVISTRFPHAVELLQNGAGVIVDQQDATQIADAIRGILGHAGRAAEMSAAASRVSVGTGWPEVAQQYWQLAESILTVHAA